jgi:beta-glucosidase
LSYTTFSLSDVKVSKPSYDKSKNDISITVSVTVANTGNVAGAEVVQVYTTLPTTSHLSHPPLQLKAFKKIFLEPGKTQTLDIPLDKYAVSYWDDVINRWVGEKGKYTVRVGTGSDDPKTLVEPFEIEKTFEWNGL